MSNYRVLLLGGGGREHAMAWKIAQSPFLQELYIAPGNPGTTSSGINVELDISDFNQVSAFVEKEQINLIIVGPEQPLVDGITDYFKKKNIPVFGPEKLAAMLEGSKEFAKDFMQKYDIPTAKHSTFSSDHFDDALSYIQSEGKYPVVLKADGLAGGKGVFICESEEEVAERLDLLKNDESLQEAASKLVIEEFMEGEEASVFVISDGDSFQVIHNAQDHKRIGEGDTGLNTGGMGAYSPAPIISKSLMKQVEDDIIAPTIDGMKNEGSPYQGILYVGLMINESGPKVVEYNCRFGDPECQVVLPSLKNDLLKLIVSATEGKLDQEKIEIDDQYRCCVVMASEGYPVSYEKGKEINGINTIDSEAIVFHAGTAIKNGKLITNGGRVLNVVGNGNTLRKAIDHAYANVEKVTFSNSYVRKDIGHKGLKHLD
ncbi:MAG: phosphoribosylamine--glycine ligase [Balneolaceae bacterium]